MTTADPPRSLMPPRPTLTGSREVTVWPMLAMSALFAVAVLLAVIGRIADSETARLIGVLGALFFGVGPAPLQFSRRLDLPTRLGVSVLIALTVLVGVGALMADIRPLWHPTVAAAIVGATAGALHLAALLRFARAGDLHQLGPRRAAGFALRAKVGAPRPSLPLAMALVGNALWLSSAILAGHIVPGIGGFLTKISPLWFVGLGFVLASILLAPPQNERLYAFSVLSLGLATTLTPALVYGAPRSQSAAKQVELVLLILRQHHITPGAGIYQAYSAFFAGIAWLCRTSGVSSPFGLATYWPALVVLLRVTELRFLTNRTIASARARWIAVTLVLLVDAIGADYFSPQSFGYVLALGMIGLVIKGVGAADPSRSTFGAGSQFVLLGCASLALAPSHELTPFVVGGTCLLLVVFDQRQGRIWAGAVVLLPAIAWAALEHNVVKHFVSLSTLFDASNFVPPQSATTPGLQRLPIVGLSSHALLLGVVVLLLGAAVGLVRNRRTRWAWAYALAPAVGLAYVAVNPYGNEGIFRATLFAIPWLALLAVHAGSCTTTRSGWRLRGAKSVLPLAFACLLTTFCIAQYGLDGSLVIHRADVEAGAFFDATAPPRSFTLTVGYGDNPVEGPRFLRSGSSSNGLAWSQVIPQSASGRGPPTSSDLQQLTLSYRRAAQRNGATSTSRLYALWSPSLLLYSEEYGELSPSQMRGWLHLLLSSRTWQPVFHKDGSYLFELSGPAATQT